MRLLVSSMDNETDNRHGLVVITSWLQEKDPCISKEEVLDIFSDIIMSDKLYQRVVNKYNTMDVPEILRRLNNPLVNLESEYKDLLIIYRQFASKLREKYPQIININVFDAEDEKSREMRKVIALSIVDVILAMIAGGLGAADFKQLHASIIKGASFDANSITDKCTGLLFAKLLDYTLTKTEFDHESFAPGGGKPVLAEKIVYKIYLLPSLSLFYLLRWCVRDGCYISSYNNYETQKTRPWIIDIEAYKQAMFGGYEYEEFDVLLNEIELRQKEDNLSVFEALVNLISYAPLFIKKNILNDRISLSNREAPIPEAKKIAKYWFDIMKKYGGGKHNNLPSGHPKSFNSSTLDFIIDTSSSENSAHAECRLNDAKKAYPSIIKFVCCGDQVRKGAYHVSKGSLGFDKIDSGNAKSRIQLIQKTALESLYNNYTQGGLS